MLAKTQKLVQQLVKYIPKSKQLSLKQLDRKSTISESIERTIQQLKRDSIQMDRKPGLKT